MFVTVPGTVEKVVSLTSGGWDHTPSQVSRRRVSTELKIPIREERLKNSSMAAGI